MAMVDNNLSAWRNEKGKWKQGNFDRVNCGKCSIFSFKWLDSVQGNSDDVVRLFINKSQSIYWFNVQTFTREDDDLWGEHKNLSEVCADVVVCIGRRACQYWSAAACRWSQKIGGGQKMLKNFFQRFTKNFVSILEIFWWPFFAAAAVLAANCGWTWTEMVFACVDCSGNVIIETRFFDGDLLVSISKVRVFYV